MEGCQSCTDTAASNVLHRQGAHQVANTSLNTGRIVSSGPQTPDSSRTDLWHTSVDIRAGQAYSHTGGISCRGHAPADAVPGQTGVPLRWLAARSLQALLAYAWRAGFLRVGEYSALGLWCS